MQGCTLSVRGPISTALQYIPGVLPAWKIYENKQDKKLAVENYEKF